MGKCALCSNGRRMGRHWAGAAAAATAMLTGLTRRMRAAEGRTPERRAREYEGTSMQQTDTQHSPLRLSRRHAQAVSRRGGGDTSVHTLRYPKRSIFLTVPHCACSVQHFLPQLLGSLSSRRLDFSVAISRQVERFARFFVAKCGNYPRSHRCIVVNLTRTTPSCWSALLCMRY